jgi:hypothetical protein
METPIEPMANSMKTMEKSVKTLGKSTNTMEKIDEQCKWQMLALKFSKVHVFAPKCSK